MKLSMLLTLAAVLLGIGLYFGFAEHSTIHGSPLIETASITPMVSASESEESPMFIASQTPARVETQMASIGPTSDSCVHQEQPTTPLSEECSSDEEDQEELLMQFVLTQKVGFRDSVRGKLTQQGQGEQQSLRFAEWLSMVWYDLATEGKANILEQVSDSELNQWHTLYWQYESQLESVRAAYQLNPEPNGELDKLRYQIECDRAAAMKHLAFVPRSTYPHLGGADEEEE